MIRPRAALALITAVVDIFAHNWAVDADWLESQVVAALDESGLHWPTRDQVALTASRICAAP